MNDEKRELTPAQERFIYIVSALVVLLVAFFAINTITSSHKEPETVNNTATTDVSREKLNKLANSVTVKSSATKIIDGKYRYFFDIHNTSSKAFASVIKARMYFVDTDSYIDVTIHAEDDSKIPSDVHMTRFVDLNSKIGFYQTYVTEGGQKSDYTKKSEINS